MLALTPVVPEYALLAGQQSPPGLFVIFQTATGKNGFLTQWILRVGVQQSSLMTNPSWYFSVGESLLTLLFTFFLISIRPISQKSWSYMRTELKS